MEIRREGNRQALTIYISICHSRRDGRHTDASTSYSRVCGPGSDNTRYNTEMESRSNMITGISLMPESAPFSWRCFSAKASGIGLAAKGLVTKIRSIEFEESIEKKIISVLL